jgi:hypothetical protein
MMPVLTRSQSALVETPEWGTDVTDYNTVDVINFVLPGEKHFPGARYLGPGTNLSERLEADGVTPKPGNEPVDRVDEAAWRHDIAYTLNPDLRSRVRADRVMIESLMHIQNPTCRERMERFFAIPILAIKYCFESLFLKLFYR